MSITIMEDGIERPGTAEEVAVYEARASAYAATLPSRTAQAEIERLESQITNRRMRDHMLGTGGDWLADQEALIAVEREKL